MESTATARWRGDLIGGSGTASLASGVAGPLPVTWASRTEAAEGKTSPEELIAAAHAACYSMALSNGLAQAGHPPEQLDTTAVATFDRTDAGWRLTRMTLTVRGSVPGIDGDEFTRAAEAAKVGCPVSNALAGNVEIVVESALV